MSSAFTRNILFELIVNKPRAVLLFGFVLIFSSALGVLTVSKNSSVDAFVNSESLVVQARDQAAEIFGIEDPAIVAIVHSNGETLFTAEHLTTFRQINEQIRTVPGVKSDKVRSITTEQVITSDRGDLVIDPILGDGEITSEVAEKSWVNARSMTMLENILYSSDGSALLIVVPVDDPDNAGSVMSGLSSLQTKFRSADYEIHVAGVAAMNARMADSISRDTRIFVPICVLLVLVIVFAAVRRLVGMIGPVLVVAGACAVAVGMLGWTGRDYYLVTTVLPVIVVSIAVADSLHILLTYQSLRSSRPDFNANRAAQSALQQTWRPVTLTSLTTIAGFIGLSAASSIAPIAEFGWFAAAGVLAAWLLSLTILPAVIVLTNLQPSVHSTANSNRLDALLKTLTAYSSENPKRVLSGAVIVFAFLVAAASFVQFDYARARYFAPQDPILKADAVINEHFSGTNIIDVLVSAAQEGGLETEAAIQSIYQLQSKLATLPNAQKVSSISDQISLLHEHLVGAQPGTLPTKSSAVSQYLFMYEASGEPEDLNDRIDFNRQHALVRTYLNKDSFLSTLDDVEGAEQIARAWEANGEFSANVSGRLPVNASWMKELKASHPVGVMTACILIFLCSLLLFQSPSAAALSFIPVMFGVTSIYAAMAILNIDLAPATSMCAAISAGLGVDFGTHIVSALRGQRGDSKSANKLPIVVRACCFSMLALSLGLSITAFSEVPALQWYGLFISVGAAASFLSAAIILPAMATVFSSILSKPAIKEKSYA